MPPYIALTPMSDTVEISSWRRGVPLADQETAELMLPLRPAVDTPIRTRWSWFARVLVVLVIADAAGIAYVVTQ